MVNQPAAMQFASASGARGSGRGLGRAVFAAVLLLTILLPLDFDGFVMAIVTAAALMALLELVQRSRRLAAARWPLVAFTAVMLALGGLAVASAAPPAPPCQAQTAGPGLCLHP